MCDLGDAASGDIPTFGSRRRPSFYMVSSAMEHNTTPQEDLAHLEPVFLNRPLQNMLNIETMVGDLAAGLQLQHQDARSADAKVGSSRRLRRGLTWCGAGWVGSPRSSDGCPLASHEMRQHNVVDAHPLPAGARCCNSHPPLPSDVSTGGLQQHHG